MTIPPKSDPKPIDIDAVLAEHFPKEAAHRKRVEALRPSNKATLFDALATADLTRVVVSFDGYGDSGQIESIEASAGDESIELPDISISIASAVWDSDETESKSMTLSAALEQLAYDFLSETHGGWENNDGAYGDFTFDVAQRSITLDYYERYTTSENYLHEF